MFVCAQQQQQQACAFSVNIEQTRRSSRLLNYRPERRFDLSARVCRRLGTERSDLRLTILTQGRPRAEQSYISLARRREIYATHLTFIRGVHILKYICVEASFNETSWCLLLHLTESLFLFFQDQRFFPVTTPQHENISLPLSVVCLRLFDFPVICGRNY